MHFELTRSIFDEISRRDLYQLGSLEQALVFDEKKSSDLQNLMSSWNLKRCAFGLCSERFRVSLPPRSSIVWSAGCSVGLRCCLSRITCQLCVPYSSRACATRRSQGSPTNGDKMRLLLCYLATHPGRFDDAARERWAQLAQLPPRDMDTICNAQYLGVELKKAKRSKFTFMAGRGKAKKARAERTAADAQLLENGRFQPLLADTVTALIGGRLERGPEKEWDVVEANNEFDAVADAGGSAAASVGAKSMRTTKKPTWHKRGASSSGSGQGGVLNVEPVGLRSRVVVRPLVCQHVGHHHDCAAVCALHPRQLASALPGRFVIY